MASLFSGWGSSWGSSWGAGTAALSAAIPQDDNVVESAAHLTVRIGVGVAQSNNIVGVGVQADGWAVFARSAARTVPVPAENRTLRAGNETRRALAAPPP